MGPLFARPLRLDVTLVRNAPPPAVEFSANLSLDEIDQIAAGYWTSAPRFGDGWTVLGRRSPQ